jgi:hypothetical protein
MIEHVRLAGCCQRFELILKNQLDICLRDDHLYHDSDFGSIPMIENQP